MKNINNNHGFTLFELLATIIILGVIASITTVTVLNVTKQAEEQSIIITDQSLQLAARDLVNEILIPENIEWTEDPENETQEYVCFTAQALINYGFLNKNQVDDPNQLIRVMRDKETFVFINEMIVNNDADCAGGFPYVVYTVDGTKGNVYNDIQWYVSNTTVNITPKPEKFIASYFYRLNGTKSTTFNNANPVNVNVTNNGENTIYTEITGTILNSNDEKNPNRDNMTVKVNIDKIVPNVIVNTSDNIGSNNWHERGFNFNLSSNEKPSSGITYYYSTTDSTVDVNTASKITGSTLTVPNQNTPSSGTKYYFKACSNAGLCGRVIEYNVKLDNTYLPLPTITASDGISSGSWHNKNFNINITYDSCGNPEGCHIKYQIGSAPSYTSGTRYSNAFSAGSDTTSRVVYAIVCTNAGRCSSSRSYTIKLDTTPPRAPTISLGNAVSLSGSSDNLSSVTYYYRLNSGSTYQGTSISYSRIGTYTSGTTIYAYTVDAAGNKSSTTTRTYRATEADYGSVSSRRYYTCSLNNKEYSSSSAASRDCQEDVSYTGSIRYYCPDDPYTYYRSRPTCQYSLRTTSQTNEFECNGTRWYNTTYCSGDCNSDQRCESGYTKSWRLKNSTCGSYVVLDYYGNYSSYKSCSQSQKGTTRRCTRTYTGTCTGSPKTKYYCSISGDYQSSSRCYDTEYGDVSSETEYYCSKTGRYYSSYSSASNACVATCSSGYTLTTVSGNKVCRRLT